MTETKEEVKETYSREEVEDILLDTAYQVALKDMQAAGEPRNLMGALVRHFTEYYKSKQPEQGQD